MHNDNYLKIAIVGGGPSGLYLFKNLIETNLQNIRIDIFEKKSELGSGMPYSELGANDEHITNVSANEFPELPISVKDWLHTLPQSTLDRFNIDIHNYSDYKILPRLLFGQYLSNQFDNLIEHAKDKGININVHLRTKIVDIIDKKEINQTWIENEKAEIFKFDLVVICTGHNWPVDLEGTIKGYYDSPYPPVKLKLKINHPVAIKGAALTAIDAIRTIARENGVFNRDDQGVLGYKLLQNDSRLRFVMHSKSGMLPAVRFHLDNSHLENDLVLTPKQIETYRDQNDGFLSLDYVFDNDFKKLFKNKDPEFYEKIKSYAVEEFVAFIMNFRESKDPFELIKEEYQEAKISIMKKKSIYWKELLGVLSFAMNYPAKYFSAEDMQRLNKALLPLISLVIAYIPQQSCEEIIALHDAGLLTLISVGDDSNIEPDLNNGGAYYNYTTEDGEKQVMYYQTFINCVGQPHLEPHNFPFQSLLLNKTISSAKIRFRSQIDAQVKFENKEKNIELADDGQYYLRVSGIAINDNFQVLDEFGSFNKRLYIMSVPYIGGFNPDYSGLDFCEEASGKISRSILKMNKEFIGL